MSRSDCLTLPKTRVYQIIWECNISGHVKKATNTINAHSANTALNYFLTIFGQPGFYTDYGLDTIKCLIGSISIFIPAASQTIKCIKHTGGYERKTNTDYVYKEPGWTLDETSY